jgi:hypothetical protein
MRGRPTVTVACACAVVLSACVARSAGPEPTITETSTFTGTASAGPTGPVAVGPTTSAEGTCTLLDTQVAAGDVGMRLANVRVLRSGGAQVGCEFFALQDSSLATSEHLPGPNQPAIRITTTRYANTVAAHNAMVRLADSGTGARQSTIAPGVIGLAFQTNFYPHDHGTDWACAFNRAATLVVVSTVVTSPALNAIEIARAVRARL